MQVRTITVSSQRKIPHPCVDFANIASFVSLQADLSEEDNAAVCAQKLQIQADHLVEKHLARVFADISTSRGSQRAEHATQAKAAELAAKHGARP